MASDDDLKTWVSDKLMSLLGYSQRTVVQYMIGISKQAASPADLVGKLVDCGISTTDSRAFAEEIFSRVPRRSSGLNQYQKQEREAAMLARKQATYTILKDDDDIDDDHTVGGDDKSSITTASTSRKPDNHKKRFRKKTEVQDDQEDEVISRKERERQVKRRTSPDEESGSESEEERLKDQREKDELVQHMRERDAAATRKLTEQKLTRKEEEEAIRRSNAAEQDDLRSLRKYSRQEYLKKREEKKLEELRDDIEDEQYLFDGVKLSEVEQRELRHKKELYELIKKRSEEADNVNEYRMPDAYDQEGGVNQEKRFSVAMQRYRDTNAEEKMNPFAEQEAWEEHQIGKATLKYGSKNKKLASDDYQFVFEDQIDFIKASVMDGDKFDNDEMADSIEKSKAKSASEALAIQIP